MMRLIWTAATAVLAITGLAACGPSEQQLRNTTREGLLLGCRNGGDAADRATLNQAGVDINRYCTCAADRFIQSASAEQLKQLSRNASAAASDPAMQRAADQCIREQMPAAAAPAAGNEGAAEPAAPAEGAPAGGGAPAEENGAAEH